MAITSVPTSSSDTNVMLKTFFAISDRWKLTEDQPAVLLGIKLTDRDKLDEWRAQSDGVELGNDQIERVAHLAAIYEALAGTFSLPSAHEWIHSRNSNFDGVSPLEVMLHGRVVDLVRVRVYVENLLTI